MAVSREDARRQGCKWGNDMTTASATELHAYDAPALLTPTAHLHSGSYDVHLGGGGTSRPVWLRVDKQGLAPGGSGGGFISFRRVGTQPPDLTPGMEFGLRDDGVLL